MLTLEQFTSKEYNERIKQAVTEQFLQTQFYSGTETKYRLNRSLIAAGRADLIGKTLLDRSVHKQHAEDIRKLVLKKWKTTQQDYNKNYNRTIAKRDVPVPKLTPAELAHDRMAFVTILDTLEVLDVESVLDTASRFRAQIEDFFNRFEGVSCIGTIEVEIVSVTKRVRVARLKDQRKADHRKNQFCIEAKRRFVGTEFEYEDTFFLIHFHGLVFTNGKKRWDEVYEQLHDVNEWKQHSFQTEMKHLSNSYAGKKKSVEDNLSDICRYITKAANKWERGASYLKHDLEYSKSMLLDVDEYRMMNYRNESASVDPDDPIIDVTSLTPYEIKTLAEVIDGLMAMDHSRTGYQIRVGRW